MSYIQYMNKDSLHNCLYNMRLYLADKKPFCRQLLQVIPQAQREIDIKINGLQEKVNEIELTEKRRTSELLRYGKFSSVTDLKRRTAEDLEPLKAEIVELEDQKAEITKGLQADQKLKQAKAKAEAQKALEKKKDLYANEVAHFNGYKYPENLIKAVKALFDCCQGSSAGGDKNRLTVAEKLQTLLSMPERYQKLKQLRMELEAAGAIEGLRDLPALDEKLVSESEKTRSRAASLLGYDPLTHELFTQWDGTTIFQPRGGGVIKFNTTQRLEESVKLQARKNSEAKAVLIKQGVISK
ncbi:MAG: hypothetical protein AVO38_10995 [delta proteobacterium ML8_D]|nr:MAG: hypothetical protein AVO34_05385 [Firmicutes bacterium ML8_F2]OPL15113.1 MAG: hypothetical protein AVO38_10995 [delta proteobacterium ML8_D]